MKISILIEISILIKREVMFINDRINKGALTMGNKIIG